MYTFLPRANRTIAESYMLQHQVCLESMGSETASHLIDERYTICHARYSTAQRARACATKSLAFKRLRSGQQHRPARYNAIHILHFLYDENTALHSEHTAQHSTAVLRLLHHEHCRIRHNVIRCECIIFFNSNFSEICTTSVCPHPKPLTSPEKDDFF